MARRVTAEEVQAVFATSTRMSVLVAVLLEAAEEVDRQDTGSVSLHYSHQQVRLQMSHALQGEPAARL